jgi:hypothetical protein
LQLTPEDNGDSYPSPTKPQPVFLKGPTRLLAIAAMSDTAGAKEEEAPLPARVEEEDDEVVAVEAGTDGHVEMLSGQSGILVPLPYLERMTETRD